MIYCKLTVSMAKPCGLTQESDHKGLDPYCNTTTESLGIPLSNPYFAYPGTPFRGYHNFKLYNKELKRLYTFLDDCDMKPKTNVYICIGAAMEEVIGHNSYEKHYQWKQLFPDHLQNFILNNKDSDTQLIIISPNDTFSDDNYKDPVFISRTDELFDWTKIENRKYTSTKYNVTVNIFCTMMPHDDSTRNKLLMTQLKRKKELCEYFSWLSQLEQTRDDLEFTNIFYKVFGKFLDSVNNNHGIISCFSFAVFNEVTEFRKYNNYAMFSEIKKLFSDDATNRLLLEWCFRVDSTEMKFFSKKGYDIRISYNDNTRFETLFIFDEDGKLTF